MLRIGSKVRVYDGDLVGWIRGTLVNPLGPTRWTILTEDGSLLDRHVKEEYDEVRNDGCGYVVEMSCCPQCKSKQILESDTGIELFCCDCRSWWSPSSRKINCKEIEG